MEGIAYDRKMSDAEGLMWRLESDPHLSSTFGALSLLDRVPDVGALRRRLDRASRVMPRLRQVVRTAPGNLAPPSWVDDPGFDIDHHVRTITLPAPGSRRALLDLAALITSEPFDASRPLWQFTIVDGLADGGAALVQKMHHTIADGESGVRLSLEYLDFERDAAEPPPPAPAVTDTESGAPTEDEAVELVRDVLASTLRIPIGVARQVRELLAEPAQIPAATNDAADTLRSIVAQLSETDRARSPLWTERSLDRRLEITSAPFRPMKDVAKQLGGTLNTAFMTVAADAAGRYHRELDSPVESLRASMAVSTRTDGSGANAFSLVRLLVPTAEMGIDERFREVERRVADAVEAARGGSLDTVAALATALPTSMLTRLARQQAQTVDFATSNVKGSPAPMYVAGAKITGNHAIGPLSGVAFNLTLLSYLGQLDMGLNTDAAAVREPELLTRCIEAAVGDFVAMAG